MSIDLDPTETDSIGDLHFDLETDLHNRAFDARLLQEPVSVLRARSPVIFHESDTVSEAMSAMQRMHRGCVLVTENGTRRSRLTGIFTERDVLNRIIGAGENPVSRSLADVMTRDPECLPIDATVAWVLNKMSVGGFRHVPIVDAAGCPAFVASVRDAVQFLVEAFPAEILNLPPEFGLARYRTREGA